MGCYPWIAFPFLAAWILARKINNVYLRSVFVLWLTLFFIIEAPLHPPFMLAAIIVFAFMSSRSFSLRADLNCGSQHLCGIEPLDLDSGNGGLGHFD